MKTPIQPSTCMFSVIWGRLSRVKIGRRCVTLGQNAAGTYRVFQKQLHDSSRGHERSTGLRTEQTAFSDDNHRHLGSALHLGGLDQRLEVQVSPHSAANTRTAQFSGASLSTCVLTVSHPREFQTSLVRLRFQLPKTLKLVATL